MKLDKYPLFNELLKVFDHYEIQSWTISDFMFHINEINGTDASIDCHKFGRLIFRLVKDGYLTFDSDKSQGSSRTFSGTEKLKYIRNTGINEIDTTVQDLLNKKAELEVKYEGLMSEVKALEALKDSYPSIKRKIEEVICIKSRQIIELIAKIKAVESVVNYICSSK
ncbi:hypothetical protein [Acinetobacter sp. F-1]|jgi:hypothetical protein|nr:hypothetical protein [Acinetobacter sp. F-1]